MLNQTNQPKGNTAMPKCVVICGCIFTEPRIIELAVKTAEMADEETRIAFWELQGDILGSMVEGI